MRTPCVFASGSGTNFEAIVSACEQGRTGGEVVLMVCDKPGARLSNGLPRTVSKRSPSPEGVRLEGRLRT